VGGGWGGGGIRCGKGGAGGWIDREGWGVGAWKSVSGDECGVGGGEKG